MNKIFIISILLFFLQPKTSNAQQDWEKPFERSEKAYLVGDYRSAYKALPTKVIQKMTDKPIQAIYYAFEGKYKDGLGKFGEMEKSLTQAVSLLNQDKKINPQSALARLRIADTYNAYGNPSKGLENILKAKEIADQLIALDTVVKLNVYSSLAKTYFLLGELNESLELAKKLLPTALKEINVSSITYNYQRKGQTKSKTRKLSTFEILQRKNLYADLLLIKANSQAKKGDITDADVSYQSTENWIKTNIGEKSYMYNKCKYDQVKSKEADAEDRESIRGYEKVLGNKGKRSFSAVSKFGIEVTESLVKQYYEEGSNRSKKEAKDLLHFGEKDIHTAYGSRTIYDVLIDEMRAERFSDQDDLDKQETRLNKLLRGRLNGINNLPTDFSKTPKEGINTFLNLGTYDIPADHPYNYQIALQMYDVAFNKGDYPKALIYLNRALIIKKNLFTDQVPEWYTSKLKLGSFYTNGAENLPEAEKILNECLPIVQSEYTSQNADYIDGLNDLAKIYDYTDRYQKAIDVLQETANSLKKRLGEKENLPLAEALSGIGYMQLRAGNYKIAESNLDNAIKLFESKRRGRRMIAYARALQTKARLYTTLGLYKEAETLLDKSESKSIRKHTSDNISVKSLDDIGFLYIKKGLFSKVEEPLLQSLINTEKQYGAVHRNLINTLNMLASLKYEQADYIKAQEYIRRASDIAVKLYGENSDRNATCLLTLGHVQASLGDYEKSEQSLQKAIQITQTNRNEKHILLVDPMASIAEIKFLRTNSVKESETLLNQAKEIVAKELGTDSPLYAEVLKKTSLIYTETNKLDQALNLLNDANNIYTKKLGKSNKNSADVYSIKGDLYSKKKDFKNAELNYENAKTIYEDVFNKRYPAYKKTVGKLGRMYFIKGDYKKSQTSLDESTDYYLKYLKQTFPSLSEGEKAKFWNSIRGDFEFYNTLAIKQKDVQPELLGKIYDFQLATKAILLSSSVKVRERILSSPDTSLKAKYKRWINLKEFFNNVISLNSKQLQEGNINPDKVEQQIEDLEKDLSGKSEAFAKGYDSKDYKWENVKENLKSGEAALEVIRFRYFTTNFSDSIVYAALIVTPQTRKNPELVVFKNGNQLESKFLKYYNNNIKLKNEENISYKQFWEPIDKYIKAEKIFLSPDGVYNMINVSSLHTPDNKYILDKYNVILVSNTRDIITKKLSKRVDFSDKSVVLIGNPSFYAKNDTIEKTLESLPGAEVEVKAIQELFNKEKWNAKKYIEADADEDVVKKLNSPRVFHVATHGYFLADEDAEDEVSEVTNENKQIKNPLLRSGLVFKGGGDVIGKKKIVSGENGILSAYEAMNLNFDNTELVVLSACETGKGEVQVGEGVFGLQRAFLVAGADAIIMSLFKVNDEVTQKLMLKFYQKWLKTGSKRIAFAEAQKEIKDEYKYPIFWGAFNMIGID